jgi:hypothetical protein
VTGANGALLRGDGRPSLPEVERLESTNICS